MKSLARNIFGALLVLACATTALAQSLTPNGIPLPSLSGTEIVDCQPAPTDPITSPIFTTCTTGQIAQLGWASPRLTGDVSITSGALAPGLAAFSLTATQPSAPIACQSGVSWTITSAGSATQPNRAFVLSYAAGYTGSSNTQALNVTNNAAGTAGALIPAAGSNGFSGNAGIFGNAQAVTDST
jgi:hypothetical protein